MGIYSTTKYYLILNAYSKCWGYIHFLNYMIGDKVVTYHNDFCVVFRIKQCNQYEFIQLVRIYALTYISYKGHFRNNVSFLKNFKMLVQIYNIVDSMRQLQRIVNYFLWYLYIYKISCIILYQAIIISVPYQLYELVWMCNIYVLYLPAS